MEDQVAINEWEEKLKLLIAQDRLLWEKVCQTVIPLHRDLSPSVQKDIENIGNKKLQVAQVAPLFQEPQQRSAMVRGRKEMVAQTEKIQHFNRAIYRKVAKGHRPIEARIDLHGLVQDEAYFSLKEFFQSSQQRGLSHVLVITGKGRSHGSDGALYRFVPHWLSTAVFRCYVYAFEQASPQHGGRGALYVWLRRSI
ncbi:Smr domain-containing protein [Bartonella bacilliformis]|uniref:Smr domain protein n=2 Tax=Bartonella bacilliformis TaxID=774 RepID=A1UU89_BARBK|nr:Smr domain protein [Bartonella bacilliformis KC583]AMG86263.1 Smr domain-containing protein [Bartonella bacilliformis]EKS43174.1 Smr domain-containing protein [Bartonella bacilliformis INS]KZN22343.1 Smr domain-containing protein [Bartonella bacilliformis]QFZ90828.1 Smr domain-containing protein [Bartonella bacilliformis]